MKHNVNMKNLLKFEREYKLKQREIYGVNYWYCRRTRTLNDIIAIANGQQNMCDKEKIKMTRFFSFKNFIDKKNKNIDIFLITDARRIKQGNRYESIYTDEIERIVKDKFSCLTLEEPSWTCYMNIKTSHYYNCTTKNIKYVDLYEYEAKLKIILFKRFNIKKLKNIEKEVEILINEINNYFDIDISTIKDDYVDHIIYFIVMKKRYTKLIEKIKEDANKPVLFDVLKFINELYDNDLVDREKLYIDFQGGNISCLKNHEEIINTFLTRGVGTIYIPTNNIVYMPIIEKLLRIKKGELCTALDSGCSETYLKIKQVDKFDKSIENIKKYITAAGNDSIIIKYIIVNGYNDNLEEFKMFLNKMIELNVKIIVLDIDYRDIIDGNFTIPKHYYDILEYAKETCKNNNMDLGIPPYTKEVLKQGYSCK